MGQRDTVREGGVNESMDEATKGHSDGRPPEGRRLFFCLPPLYGLPSLGVDE